MTFSLTPATPFTAFVSTVTAGTLNYWRTAISQAVDGASGGAYTPTAAIDIGGTFGLKISATGPSAQWLQLASRTVTILHPLVLSTVVQSVGTGGTDSSGLVTVSDQTASIGGLTVGTGCIVSPPAATTAPEASYYILELVRPPDGSVLGSVYLETKGITGAAGTLPKYTLVRWAPGGVPSSIGAAVDVTDDHTLGVNWLTNIRTQTIASNGTTTIDITAYRYGVLVKNPYDVAGSSFRVYSVKADYAVTVHAY